MMGRSLELPSLIRLCSLVPEAAGDDEAHDFIGALEDLVHAHVPDIALDVVVPQVPVPPMQLQRVVAHLPQHRQKTHRGQLPPEGPFNQSTDSRRYITYGGGRGDERVPGIRCQWRSS